MEYQKNPEEFVYPALELLRRIDSISVEDKKGIMLVLEGLKPAVLIEMAYQEGAKGYLRSDFENDIKSLDEVLGGLGLKFLKKDSADDGFFYTIYYIGKTEESLKDLTDAVQTRDHREKDVAKGKALGIPETAINAFIDNRTIALSELPPEAAKDFQTANFMPSRDHWQEELELVRSRNEAVRKWAPYFND